MPRIPVDRIDDPRLDVYRNLPHSKSAQLSRRFVVEGRLLVERLAASHYPLESVLVDSGRLGLLASQIPTEVPVYTASPESMGQIVGFEFHRGILACGRRRPYPLFAALLPDMHRRARLVICDAIQDATNLGGILRNAAAFGVDAVLLSRACADPFSRRVLRVSMGAVFELPLARTADLTHDLQQLRNQHHIVAVAAVLDAQAEPLEQIHGPSRWALLFGNEGCGLDADLVALCDRRVTVPMAGQIDSLNASVASGVFLYHFTRVAAGP